uniref:Putative glutathione S-transferase epsilon class member 4 n=1 Tax=Leptinotarsa decemlineata TaxID=7539 RepID=A0A1P8PEV1_LEPDE|nr:putative glutathione S-transferase epsilon class member 4 [Leptinotarsa decemlineata]
MAPKLYWFLDSPPARAVVLVAKQLEVELELIEVNLSKREQYKPEFLKMNPLHTIPVLDDDGFIVTDSHAIMSYLVLKYGNGSSLYPEDVKKRCLVDQRLYFESGTFFANHFKVCIPVLYKGETIVPSEGLKFMIEAYDVLEEYFQNSNYVAGDDLTIADFSIWTTITNSSVYLPVDENKYTNISAWLKRMEATPNSDLNKAGGDNIEKRFVNAFNFKNQ